MMFPPVWGGIRASRAVADTAGCARSTVAEALKALEFAGVLSWQHRITRVRERCVDLFGNITWQWRVHRRSNAYAAACASLAIRSV
jgi:DNA-binding FadR family transcriptional regulator